MPTSIGVIAPPPPRPPVINIVSPVRPLPTPMSMVPGHPLIANQQSLLASMHVTSLNIPVPDPGSQFTPLGGPRPFVHIPIPQSGIPMVPPAPMLQAMPPPQPDEPEPKRQRLDDSMLVPEDQFLVQHSGPARISIFVPNVDEANLKGRVLEIMVQSLSETVGSLKEKNCRGHPTPCKQTKAKWEGWFPQGQFITCLLQYWSWRLVISISQRMWW